MGAIGALGCIDAERQLTVLDAESAVTQVGERQSRRWWWS